MRTEDGDIISKCLSGDRDAFGLLIDKYKAGVYALAYARLRNFHDAQDVAQEVFLKAFENLHTLKRWEKFASWLYRITARLCINWQVAHSRRPDNEFVEDFPPDVFDNQTMDSYHAEHGFDLFHEALDSLPEIHREVLNLYYFGGMTSYEIANFIGTSSDVIRQRIVKARSMLKEELVGAISIAFEEKKLRAEFTLNVLEMLKYVRIHPLPQERIIPWGISLTGAIMVVIMAFGMLKGLPIIIDRYSGSGSGSTGVIGKGDIPVFISNDADIESGGGTSMLSAKKIGAVVTLLTVVAVLSSNAQTQWTEYPGNPILTGSEAWDGNRVDKPCVIFNGNLQKYEMWYGGYNGTNWQIGYASSPDGITWTKHSSPVLTPGPSGNWDGHNIIDCSVIFDGNNYKMWYSGESQPLMATAQIGYATSTDGIHWNKYSGNPVLSYGTSWDSIHVEAPCVIFNDGIYKMWYKGSHIDYYHPTEIGYATSSNGYEWTKYSGNPVLKVGSGGSWDNYEVTSPCVIFNGSKYEMWYNGNNSPYGLGYKFGYATSINGISWTKYDDPNTAGPLFAESDPVMDVGMSGSWNNFAILAPNVLLDGSIYKIWYSGSDGLTDRIGYATSPPIITPNQPVIGNIIVIPSLISVNTSVNASADFTDPNAGDTHTAIWDWGDGTLPETINIELGSRIANGSHAYTAAGVYTITLTVSDSIAEDQAIYQYVVVYDPSAGFVTGGGWITSPTGAYAANSSLTGKANFGFVSKYQKGAIAPTGNTQFNFKVADLNFNSTEYEWLVVAGAKAQYKGSGTINGAGEYQFMLTAIDGQINGGGGIDKFRIKIWADEGGLVYDNKMNVPDTDDLATDDPATVLGGGSIVIHKDNNAAPPMNPIAKLQAPKQTRLLPAFPNPFNPETWIPYQLANNTDVTIKIYNASGSLVRLLNLGNKPLGIYSTQDKAAYWDGRNETGEQVSSGVYFYTIKAGDYTATRKMLMLK